MGALTLGVVTLAPTGPTTADAAPAPVVDQTRPAPMPGVDRSYGHLPLAFMRDGDAYVARTASGSISLRRGEATIRPSGVTRVGDPITVGLHGAADVVPRVAQRLPGVVNDLRGDPGSWRTEVPTFGRVRYAGVYPGIDLDYHGTTGTLEYDFRVARGADPSVIGVDFHGAAVRLDTTGDLVVGTGPDRVRQAAPVAFQPSVDGRDPVDARFTLHGDRVGFDLGAYDATRPLVIDPLVLSYATLLGGSDEDRVEDIAVGTDGATYLTGYTVSTDLPTTAGAYDTTRNDTSATDAFVTKINAAGSALVYSTLLGGSDTDTANAIAVDTSGNAYVTGWTKSILSSTTAKFPTAGGAYTNTSNDPGWGDAFVTKLNAAGNALVYSSTFGGQYLDEPLALALDPSGAAYVGGATSSTGNSSSTLFPANGFQQVPGGTSDDGFVTKLDAAGGLGYSTFLGGIGQDAVNGVDVDSQGRAYVTGFAAQNSNSIGNGFPTTSANRFAAVESNGADAFLTRIAASGASLDYSTGIGASSNGQPNNGSDYGYAVAVQADGIVYVAGSSRNGTGPNGDFPLKHEFQGRPGGCCFAVDAFVAKFDTSASGADSLVYSTLIGGNGEEGARAMDVDSAGNAYVAGTTYYESGLFYPTTADELGGGAGRGRLFVTKVVQSGSSNATLGFSTTIQGTSYTDSVGGLVYVETAAAVYVGGTTWGGNPTTTGAYQTTPQGNRDGFAAKIAVGNDSTPPDTSITAGPANSETVTSDPVSFTISATESSTFECRYDGGSYAPCSTPGPGLTGADSRTLANGSHTFSVRARDGSGNVDATPDTRTFTVDVGPPADAVAPNTIITKRPPKTVKVKRRASVTVKFTSTEAGSTFTCRVDRGHAHSCRSGATFRLGIGKHTISIVAIDAAGNADRSPATVKVTVKKKPRKPTHG